MVILLLVAVCDIDLDQICVLIPQSYCKLRKPGDSTTSSSGFPLRS